MRGRSFAPARKGLPLLALCWARRTRRPQRGRWPLPYPPDRGQMIGVGRRKDVFAVRLRDKVEVADRCGIERREEAGVTGLIDGTRRESGIQIRVIRRSDLQLLLPDAAEPPSVG